MTFSQVQWAKQHDWYISSYLSEETNKYVVIVVDTSNADRLEFSSLTKLRNWAGY